MKCNLIKFLLFIIFVYNLSKVTGANLKREIIANDTRESVDKFKLIRCKICQEMFDCDFNYEVFLKSNKISIIQKAFGPLDKKDLKDYFNKDNMEFVTKEISMEYFFKGAESQSEELNALKTKTCKNNQDKEECEHWKLETCEKVLSFEQGICVDMKVHFKNLITKNRSGSTSTPDNNVKSYPVGKDNDSIINFKKYFFKQKENRVGIDRDPDLIKQYGDMSLLELSPEAKIPETIPSTNPEVLNSFDTTTKSHWKPPKPVLLQNFQSNIADQLKDISSIASEISTLEKRLKNLKQQLANKLEVAQSSYNVVAKTLSEISKMVNNPESESNIQRPAQVTEDDWDEASKPKFIK